MNATRAATATATSLATPTPGDNEASPPVGAFLERVDWASFGVTTVLAFAAYCVTLAPDVTLGLSGIFATGAMYAGVPHPPGYPLWTIYAWLFTNLIPFSNIAWRVAVSSAVAGAVTSGLVSLLVSRGGAAMLAGFPAARKPTAGQITALRIVCGTVAGLGFAFDHGQWRKAVLVDPWPLSALLFALTLTLLRRWFHAPACRGRLYAACLVYGLTLCNSQLLLAAAFGLLVLVMLGEAALRREICLACGCLSFAIWFDGQAGRIPPLEPFPQGNLLRLIFVGVCVACFVVGVVFTCRSHGLSGKWKPVAGMALAFTTGLLAYLYVPIASLTNPPVNRGYARTVEGFAHVLSRGQYERMMPTPSFERLWQQFCSFPLFGAEDFGWTYVIVAFVPFGVARRLPRQERLWLVGLLAVYLCLTVPVLIALNPPPDRQARDLIAPYFAASRLILAIWAGYGLVLIGAWHAGRAAS